MASIIPLFAHGVPTFHAGTTTRRSASSWWAKKCKIWPSRIFMLRQMGTKVIYSLGNLFQGRRRHIMVGCAVATLRNWAKAVKSETLPTQYSMSKRASVPQLVAISFGPPTLIHRAPVATMILMDGSSAPTPAPHRRPHRCPHRLQESALRVMEQETLT